MEERAPLEHRSQAVMIDVGPGFGALIISADAGMLGDELEISNSATPGQRQHVYVLMRSLPRGTAYAAVFPRLPAGEYLLWDRHRRLKSTESVREGRVTTVAWSNPTTADARHGSSPSMSNPITCQQGV